MKKLNNYRIFTEGVIFLMKRKTKTGVKMITSLVERIGKATANNLENNNQHNSLADPKENSLLSSDFIYDLVFLYRAYGHFMLEDYDLSLKDYIKSNQIKKLTPAAQYNMTLAQGMKAFTSKEFETAISFFTKAQ